MLTDSSIKRQGKGNLWFG